MTRKSGRQASPKNGGDVEELSLRFAEPPAEYRMVPLLRYNDEPDREKIRWQVRSLREQGCGGLFAYCERFKDGVPFRFLSEDWWRVVEWMAEACAEEGLQFWVYDEEDWPSGSAGGQLLEKHPEFSWKYLRLEEHTFTGPATAALKVDPVAFVAASAYRKEGNGIRADSIVHLSDAVKDGTLEWQVPEGEWTVAVYTVPTGKGVFLERYTDLMDREAAETFVDWVYEGHRKRLAKIAGLDFRGYFTDEPCMSLALIRFGPGFDWFPAMPYTPALPEAFRERYGCDWRAGLPYLYYHAGPETVRFRCRHWETCWRLYHENYFGRIYRFCDRHGLAASGHLVIEEEFLGHLSLQGGNLLSHYRYMHVPGIDWIHPFENRLPATVPKYAASMAHLLGRARTWSEPFAASGWGLTFQEMRRIVNWQFVNGISMLIPICYKHSLRGPNRTAFYNPGISYQQPYWSHFRGFADYAARMCLLVSDGGHVAQVALAYPEVDMRANCWDVELLGRRSAEYNQLGDAIRAAGYDFDVLEDRTVLEESRIESGRLRTATERFEVLLVPRSDAVRRDVIRRYLEFVRAGGIVVFLGNLPVNSLESGGDDPALAELVVELVGVTAGDAAKGNRAIWKGHRKGRAGFAPTVDDAIRMLREVIPADVTVSPATGDLFGYHRRVRKSHLYLLYSRSDSKRTFDVTLRATGYPELWDPVRGTVHALTAFESGRETTRLTLEFAPDEVKVVMLLAKRSAAPPLPEPRLVREIPIEGPFEFHAADQTRVPELAWNFTQAEDGWTSIAAPLELPGMVPAGDWCGHGLAAFSGLGRYRTDVEVDDLPQDTRVVLDLGKVAVSAEVLVNGERVGLAFFEPYTLDVTAHVHPGSNRLEIVVANTLSNYYSQFKELEGKPLSEGGDRPERRLSGLLGPVVLRFLR